MKLENIPANDGRIRFGENEQPTFDTATNVRVLEKFNWTKKEAEELNTVVWQIARIFYRILITSQKCEDYFASESDFYVRLQMIQEHIQAWKSFEGVIQKKIGANKLKNATSFMPKQIELISKVESIARANSLPVLDPNEHGLTSRANKKLELVAAAEKATDTLVKAAEGMRKPPTQPADQMVENSDVLAPCSDSDAEDIDRSANGYYIVITDHTALEPILDPSFPHLCKAMKEIKKVKAEQERVEEEEVGRDGSEELRRPVAGCSRNKQAGLQKEAIFR